MSIPPSTHQSPPDAHLPVMLEEMVDAIALREDGIYVDCTFGRGGHTRALLGRLNDAGRVFAIDRDPQAVAHARELERSDRRFTVSQARFGQLGDAVQAQGAMGKVTGVMMDLGVSSPMLDDASRGFSFNADGPLDMRMDPGTHPSAAEWLTETDETEIARVLKAYGEERQARRIARRIVETREQEPLRTTAQLARLVVSAIGRAGDKHPATRTFQAVRMEVNRELEELDAALAQVPDVLDVGGRLAVLSFHSLEDRAVKRCFAGERIDVPRGMPLTEQQLTASRRPARMRKIGGARKPGAVECAGNPRARSARLRVAEKVA